MSVSSIDKLKEQIQSLPGKLRVALEQQAKAKIDISHLETQIKRLKAETDRESETTEENAYIGNDGLEDDREMLKLESKVERLKLEISEAEDKAELEVRQSASRITEGHVKASVGVDANVSRLRHALLDAKEAAKMRKVTLQHEWQLARQAKIEERFSRKPENPKMMDLQLKLAEAQEKEMFADLEVEVIRTTVDSYKMLVHLEGLDK